jgi:hypothetical protein
MWRTFLVLGAVSALLAQQIQPSRMRADLEFLTSNAMAGRLSLDPGAAAAAEYIAIEFRKAGLQPGGGDSYLQRFPLAAYSADPSASTLTLNIGGASEQCRRGKDFQGGFKDDVTIKAAVTFAGYGITAPEYGYDDYAGLDVKGRIVLVFDHEPQENDPKSAFNGRGFTKHATRRVKAMNAERHGAVGILIADDPLRQHQSVFDPPQKTSDGISARRNAPTQALTDDSPGIPLLAINDTIAAKLLGNRSPKAWAEALDQKLKPESFDLPQTRAEIRTANTERHRAMSANVVGLLEGSDPDLKQETVLVTAHYDHLGTANGEVFHGANDNASGTAAVLEIARNLTATARPKRSILFIVFGSEEEGLLGSYHYVEHPLRPLNTTRAVLNLDMIARDEAHIPQSLGILNIDSDTSNDLQLVGTFYSPDLEKIIRSENQPIGLRIDTKFDHTTALNALFRCDHFPFLLHDVPAAWFFTGWHPCYHEPSDTIEKLNFPKMEKITQLAMRTAVALANSTAVPGFSAHEAGSPPTRLDHGSIR